MERCQFEPGALKWFVQWVVQSVPVERLVVMREVGWVGNYLFSRIPEGDLTPRTQLLLRQELVSGQVVEMEQEGKIHFGLNSQGQGQLHYSQIDQF